MFSLFVVSTRVGCLTSWSSQARLVFSFTDDCFLVFPNLLGLSTPARRFRTCPVFPLSDISTPCVSPVWFFHACRMFSFAVYFRCFNARPGFPLPGLLVVWCSHACLVCAFLRVGGSLRMGLCCRQNASLLRGGWGKYFAASVWVMHCDVGDVSL